MSRESDVVVPFKSQNGGLVIRLPESIFDPPLTLSQELILELSEELNGYKYKVLKIISEEKVRVRKLMHEFREDCRSGERGDRMKWFKHQKIINENKACII